MFLAGGQFYGAKRGSIRAVSACSLGPHVTLFVCRGKTPIQFVHFGGGCLPVFIWNDFEEDFVFEWFEYLRLRGLNTSGKMTHVD